MIFFKKQSFGLKATYTAAPRQSQTSLHCARLLRIFGHKCPFILLRLGNRKQVCIALGFCVYLAINVHLYCCASAIANKFALRSASAYILAINVHLYCCASAIANKFALRSASAQFGLKATYTAAPRQSQTSLHCARLLRIFANGLPLFMEGGLYGIFKKSRNEQSGICRGIYRDRALQ